MNPGIAGPSAWPGEEPLEAHRAAIDVLADPPSAVVGLPGLLALPDRGPWAQPVGRALALAEAMPASLESHGWRLGLTADADLRRAARVLTADVEAFALAAAGYAGSVTVPAIGPHSLAASVWLPVGDRVVSDGVALDDLTASLALGLARHAEAIEVARDVPLLGVPESRAGSDVEIVLHEPLLAEVLAGAVPTFSGMGRLRALSAETVMLRLAGLVESWRPRRVVIQVPPEAAVIAAVGAARPQALQLDVTALDERGWEALAAQVEAGVSVRCAVVPHVLGGDRPPDPVVVARSVLRPWRSIGLPTAEHAFVLLPREGVARLTPAEAVATLRATARAAVALGDELVAGGRPRG